MGWEWGGRAVGPRVDAWCGEMLRVRWGGGPTSARGGGHLDGAPTCSVPCPRGACHQVIVVPARPHGQAQGRV